VQRIVTNLWFDTQAEEAAKFYVSIFAPRYGSSRITNVSYYGEGGPGPAGSVLTVSFELASQEFTALNGGPMFKFTEAISLLVNCEAQEEVDELWAKLTADGGEESMCGWLKDKYGLSWQIIPTALGEMMSDPDAGKAQRVMQAMLQMRKIDVARLKKAYDAA
jgi:predicted 3-demethylubiquinone-9 3-methyltransferase (glyoxalase superfamily)